MDSIIVSRAKRTLDNLHGYTPLNDGSDLPSFLEGIVLEGGEFVIGFYENSKGSKQDALIISNTGIRVFFGSEWKVLRYKEVLKSSILENDKNASSHIKITKKTGEDLLIPVEGFNGKFRDIFQFLRFIDRVSNDINY